MKHLFRKVASTISAGMGSPWAFLVAFGLVAVWAVSGSFFDYSNTWQLLINTVTTIGTFLMVFLIQNAQNRDSKAVQLKLDEMIRASRANDSFIDLEDLSDEEIHEIDVHFRKLHEKQQATPAIHKLHRKLVVVHENRKK